MKANKQKNNLAKRLVSYEEYVKWLLGEKAGK